MRLLAARIACLLALAAGAVAVVAAGAPSHRPPPYAFMLLYERSGGFAPSTRSLVVAPAQLAEAVSGERRVDFRISGRRIRALERGLGRAHFAALESPGPSDCADCFEYDLLYRGHHLALDESQMPPRLGAVIAEIEAIITAHTHQRS